MAKARALVKRLKAVRNIRKITRTMELIATARFKKAMDRATEAAAYTQKISEIVADLARAQGGGGDVNFSHPLLESRDSETNSALLVLTSNRGLCGGYNAGVLRKAAQRIAEGRSADAEPALEVVGKRGINFLKFQGYALEQTFTDFGDEPKFEDVDALAERYIDAYSRKTLDRLDVAYVQFESSSRQTAVLETLLPIGTIGAEEAQAAKSGARPDYEFLPSAQAILEEIVPAAFKARLFKCFLDAAVSEQIARMVAMKGATENADEMITTLKQKYNRARQTQITSELSEIIGGVAALE